MTSDHDTTLDQGEAGGIAVAYVHRPGI